jgi:hypothetical protein
VAGSWEHSSERADSIKGGGFFDYLSYCKLLRICSVESHSYLKPHIVRYGVQIVGGGESRSFH